MTYIKPDDEVIRRLEEIKKKSDKTIGDYEFMISVLADCFNDQTETRGVLLDLKSLLNAVQKDELLIDKQIELIEKFK